MEVKPGYKQTEVGVIPKDWEVFDLKDVCERISVGLATSVTKHYRANGVPIIRNMNIKDGFFDGRDMLYVSEPFAKANATKAARAFDVLTVHTGANLGDTCLLPAIFDGCQTFTTLITTPKASLLSPRFLSLHMSSVNGKREMDRLQVGSGKGNLNTGDLKRYRISVPKSLAEQEAIAGALSDADALIESLEQLVVKKRQIKHGAMQELLTGQKRLPGFTGQWATKRLDDICTKIQDGTHFSPKLGGLDYLYVTSKNIGFGTLDISSAERISASEHAKIYVRCDVTRGDLLLTKDGANTGNAAINTIEEPISLLSSVAMLRFDKRNHVAGYFLYQILAPDGQRQIKELMSGNAITRLTLFKIRSLRFKVAPLSEQQAIAAILSDMDAEVAALEAKLAKARQVKLGMMQELLTGRIRLV